MTAGSGSMEAPQPAEPRPNPLSRLAGALFSPERTFSSIARQPDILVPLILFMVWSLISGILVAQKVDFLSDARAQLQRQNVPQEKIDQQLKVGAAISKVVKYFTPIIFLIIVSLVAGVMLLSYRLLGGEGGFLQYLSVTLYAWLPQMIKSVITTIILMTRTEAVGAAQLETLVRSNPAFLVDMQTHGILFSLLSSLDAFTIWSMVLMIIGFAYVARFSKAKSAGVLVSVWLFWIVIKVGFAALGSMMRPK